MGLGGGVVVNFFLTKTKRVFGTHPTARAGWLKHLALVRATPRAEFDVIGAHVCSLARAVCVCLALRLSS